MVGNGFDSRVVVYRVVHSEKSGGFELSFQWQDKAGTASAEHWKKTKNELSSKSDTSDQSSHSLSRFDDSPLLPAFETCEFLPSGCVVVTEDCPKEKCNLLHLYSQAGKHEKVNISWLLPVEQRYICVYHAEILTNKSYQCDLHLIVLGNQR